MASVPCSFFFCVQGPLQQDRIFSDQPSLLDLHDVDERTLLNDFIFPGCEFVWDHFILVRTAQLFDERSMVGINGIASDACFTSQGRHVETISVLLQSWIRR